MVVRKVKMLIGSALLVIIMCAPAQACFGPKLFVGVGQSPNEQALFALITLYVLEKTGVDSKRIDIEAEQDPLVLLSENKLDLVFIPSDSFDNPVFKIAGMPLLAAGKRPLQELQFTTVLPAIRKLNNLLKQGDVEGLVSRIESGESAMSAARNFLMELRWI
ncbi:MAG: hypothetical protein RQ722_04155 [Desulfuromonadales bacterium]|nr:hypothetical protein [Desulfuromonadales bacterium]